MGEEKLLRSRVMMEVLQDSRCISLMECFIANKLEL
jgi:hypothetical protein